MAMIYSQQAYQETKQQAFPRSDTALEDAIEGLRRVCHEQFQLAGIRWTADLQLREAVDNVKRVHRQAALERDIAREQAMKLKEKLNEFEKKESDHAKKTREQQSAMVQAIKVRAEKERKQLSRKYKLKLKEDEQKIAESFKADYVKMNRELAEKMSEHLKEVEAAYLAACEGYQSRFRDALDVFQCGYQAISKRIHQDNNLMMKYMTMIQTLQDQCNMLCAQLAKYQVRYFERPVEQDSCITSDCIGNLVENCKQNISEIKIAHYRSHHDYIEQHNRELEEINRKVKDVIERKDQKIAQMREAINALNSQLNELTSLPVGD